MPNEFDQKNVSVIEKLSFISKTKNPLSIILALKDLREAFNNIWESLINTIDLNYSYSSKKDYLDIVSLYKKSWFFDIIYDFYFHDNRTETFRKSIDRYFEYSFYRDISFFYFTLSQDNSYKILFDAFYRVYNDKTFKSKLYDCDTYYEKRKFLHKSYPDLYKIKYEKDIYFIISSLFLFKDFDFSSISYQEHPDKEFNWVISFMKNFTLKILNSRNEKFIKYFLNNYWEKADIYTQFVEKLDDKSLVNVISFLRKDLLSIFKFNSILDFKTKNTLQEVISESCDIKDLTNIDRLRLLRKKENIIKKLEINNWEYFRISSKRKVLEKDYLDVIDLTLWISYIPRDVFYYLKQNTKALEKNNLNLYDDIKKIILVIENSFLLSILKPFLLSNISAYFSKKDDKYYITKFLVMIVSSSSYSEYKKLSKFFVNLDAFSTRWFEWFFLRNLQFSWLYIVIILWLFIAPFWVVLAVFIWIFNKYLKTFLSKINPKFEFNFNFALGSYAAWLAIFSLMLSTTVWLKDNILLSYNNFKWAINSLSIPSIEAISILSNDISKIKTSILNIDSSLDNSNNIWFSDIDYSKDIWLYDLKNDKVNYLVDSSQLEEGIVLSSARELENTKEVYKIDSNMTFWDYTIKFALKNDLDINDKLVKQDLLRILWEFLEENRWDLIKYISYTPYRLSVWDLAKKLPVIDYDLKDLREKVEEL